jgi:hypothetical protein
MKTALFFVFALFATSAFAVPAGYDRPGGYHDQLKAGSLSKPVDACKIDTATGSCVKPPPPTPTV